MVTGREVYCDKCGHFMLEHGVDDDTGVGWCGNGNDGDCPCTVTGLSYEEALAELKEEARK